MAAQENRSLGAMIRLLPLLLLAGCTSVQSIATCGNAKRVIALAEAAATRYCPMEAR